MKKIITILSASFFLAFSALAETGMIGIKYGTGELEGTQNSYDDKRSGAGTIAARTAKEDHEYGAIFGELCETFNLTGEGKDIKLLVIGTTEAE